MSLLTTPDIIRAENQFIALLDRTFKKGCKTSTLDYKKELPRNIKRWFGSATFEKQLDSILTSIIVQSLLYADGQMKRMQAASVKESTILTTEAVNLSQELGGDVAKSIIRMLDEDAIYYEHPNALAGRIHDLWGGERYRAIRFARTFTADVATASTVHRYRQYGVRYMEFDAELDDRTTDQCRCLDGVQFDLEKDSVDAYRPPLHMHCRSGLKPITGDDLDESQLFENKDFSTALDDHGKVDRAFKNIDVFNEKYRVSKYVIDHDLATRILLDKGMSVGLDVGIENIVRKEVVSKGVPEVVEKGVFVPAKTVKEAEEWAVKNIGVTKASFKSMSVEHANEVNRSIAEFKKKFPNVKLNEIKAVKRTSGGRYTFSARNVSTGKWEDKSYNTLEINSAFFNKDVDLNTLNAHIKKIRDAGMWVPENVEQIVAHELGHTLTYQGKTMTLVHEHDDLLTTFKRFDRDTLSRYGASNDAEGIAECFAKYVRDGTVADVKTIGEKSAIEIIKEYTGVELK